LIVFNGNHLWIFLTSASNGNAATFLRKEFGLETARIILGHRSAVITEVYAEQDQQKALEAIVRVG